MEEPENVKNKTGGNIQKPIKNVEDDTPEEGVSSSTSAGLSKDATEDNETDEDQRSGHKDTPGEKVESPEDSPDAEENDTENIPEGEEHVDDEGSGSETEEGGDKKVEERREERRPNFCKEARDSTTVGMLDFCKALTSIKSLIKVLYQHSDPSSLAVSRILFGILMFFDIPEERGLSEADIRWGDPEECRFPLFDFLEPLPLHWMCVLYLIMWLGALGIALGAFFKLSCLAFIIPYWYVLFLDKTAWNNHSYLFGILGIIFYASDANYYWSIDAWRGKVPKNMDIPVFNYVMFRFQFFLLYFHAGIKKTEYDWITGHSMQSLSRHWVFTPFTPFLSPENIDLYVVHGFGFLLDLTVGFFIYFDSTRPLSFLFLICFHLMNSQMFYIGMFPFVCVVTMPLYCHYSWPKTILQKLRLSSVATEENAKNPECVYVKIINDYDEEDEDECEEEVEHYHGRSLELEGKIYVYEQCEITGKKRRAVWIFLIFAFSQLFLPYSHFITKGYNNWTNGLYGYSWDMMVHSWDTSLTTVKVINHDANETVFIDPEAWVRSNKWQRHADMIMQYSRCLKDRLEKRDNMKNISLYIDVWASLNRRVHQRMFDPHVDILKTEWNAFKEVKWVMPLLENLTHLRNYKYKFQKTVHEWSDAADVIFMADFPGYRFQNFIHESLSNITIVNLDGTISVDVEGDKIYDLSPQDSMKLPSGKFHEIRTLSKKPSVFMYTFFNETKLKEPKPDTNEFKPTLFDDLSFKIDNIITSIGLVSNGFLRSFYSVPMIRRVRVHDPGEF